MPTPRVTIDQLPEQGVPEDTNLLVVHDGDTTKKMSIATLKTVEPTGLAAHIADPTGAHAATAISATPSGGGITGADVQAQLGQLAALADSGINQGEGDARYLQLTGGAVSGALSVATGLTSSGETIVQAPTQVAHAATKGYVDSADALKADKSYVDTKDDTKADITYVDAADALKADKTYVDSQDALKADKTYVDSQDALKANITYVDNADALKADKTYVDAADALKADKTYVDSKDATKADITYVNSADALKADKTYVDSQDATKLTPAQGDARYGAPTNVAYLHSSGNDSNDGKTWATAKLTLAAAVGALPAAGGEVLFDGTITGGSVLSGRNHVTVRGFGASSVFYASTDTPALSINNCVRLSLLNFRVTGSANVAHLWNRGIQAINMTDSVIDGIWTKDTGYDGIVLLSGNHRNVISNCIIENAGDDGINIGGDAVAPTTGNKVIGNHVYGAAHIGIHLSDGSSGSVVTGNVTEACLQYGLDTRAAAHGNIIVGNRCPNGIHLLSNGNQLVANVGAVLDEGVGNTVDTAPGPSLYLPGTTGHYVSAPDAAALDIVGDISLRCHVALDDWTGAADQYLVAKYGTGTNQRSYAMYITTTGRIVLRTSADGTGTVMYSETSVVPPLVNGQPTWIRADRDVDNGTAGNTTRFYTSVDGAIWTEIGTPFINAGITSIFASTVPLEVGSHTGGGAGFAKGKFYRAQVLNSAGALVADWRADQMAPVYTDSYGTRWTVNGAAWEWRDANGLKIGPQSGGVITGIGFPEGVVTAVVGTRYIDSTAYNGAIEWIKASGTGNTGWRVSDGDTGWRNVISLATGMDQAQVYRIRRTNQTVHFTIEHVSTYPGTLLAAQWNTIAPLPVGFRGAYDNNGVGYNGTGWIRLYLQGGGTNGVQYLGNTPPLSNFGLSFTYTTIEAWPATLPGT